MKSDDTNNGNEMYLLMNDALLLVGFVWRSIKRHRIRSVIVFLSIVGLAAALIPFIPKTYDSNARILTHPSRTLLRIQSYESRSSAAELIKSRENLEAVIEEANLIERWQQTRTPIGRIKDRVMSAIFGEESTVTNEEDFNRILLYILGKKVSVEIYGNVVNITVYWHDAETAFIIAECIVRRFLDEQYKLENAEYLLDIANYERRLKLAEQQLSEAEKAYKEILSKQVVAGVSHANVERSVQKVAEAAPPPLEEDGMIDVEDLERELEMKRREMKELQTTYARRVAEAKNRLAELKLTMGPRHPDVMKAERLVEILSSPPAALTTLRNEQDAIATRLENARIGAKSQSPRRRRLTSRKAAPDATESLEEITEEQEEQERLEEYQRAKMRRNRIAEELSNAHIEYDAGKAVLDFRFQVTQPPTRAKGPIKPNPKKILVAAVVAGLFLGVFLSVFIDIRSGIIIESWQVARILNVPVLGEMDDMKDGFAGKENGKSKV